MRRWKIFCLGGRLGGDVLAEVSRENGGGFLVA